jgi:hypothetical protein
MVPMEVQNSVAAALVVEQLHGETETTPMTK